MEYRKPIHLKSLNLPVLPYRLKKPGPVFKKGRLYDYIVCRFNLEPQPVKAIFRLANWSDWSRGHQSEDGLNR